MTAIDAYANKCFKLTHSDLVMWVFIRVRNVTIVG
jgi:hypothetical protein